jgi:DNA-binding Xre family transcriptional regulator
MRWNLRLVAARRGIWKATDLRLLLARHGLIISSGKMSALWSGTPHSIKLSDLMTICVALDCDVADLLVPNGRVNGEEVSASQRHAG